MKVTGLEALEVLDERLNVISQQKPIEYFSSELHLLLII